MNKTDRENVTKAAQCIMVMYQELKQVHKDDIFAFTSLSQGYRDSLEAMRRNNLISNYYLDSGIIELHDQGSIVKPKSTPLRI